ncbi:hypothetical protein BHE74_00021264 [Ensete ventricosum]|nr:hypothetical protein BHE74_00021264 [Ensete ventricosum]
MEVVGSSPEGVSSSSPEVEEVSSSSGGMSPGDMKAFRALEIIRSCHSSDLVMIEELLRLVRWRYSIRSDYELHIPQPGQCPFDPFLNGFVWAINRCAQGKTLIFASPCDRYLPQMVAYLVIANGAQLGQGSYYLIAQSDFRVSDAPSNNKGWKNHHFFISHGPGWGFNLEWNLKGIPRVPTTNVTRAIEASIQATMSSVREEPTKVPKACLHEGEDACPRKKPKQAVRKVSKSFAA